MITNPLNDFWPLIYGTLQEFWAITELHIERAADQNGIPIELYYYSELGLTYFSIADFQKRDPYTNPERFENVFTQLEFKDWIYPDTGDRYLVSRKAQDAVKQIVAVGDMHLKKFASITDRELNSLLGILKSIIRSCMDASEPPEKWAIDTRFSLVNENSPLIAQVREALLYLYAYHDDAHFSAAHPHFGGAGIIWSVLGYLLTEKAHNAEQMAGRMAFRGYDESDYKVALQAAVEIGWAEPGDLPNSFRPTELGRRLREQVELQTDEYFYGPWEVLSEREVDQLRTILKKLQVMLVFFRKSTTLLLP